MRFKVCHNGNLYVCLFIQIDSFLTCRYNISFDVRQGIGGAFFGIFIACFATVKISYFSPSEVNIECTNSTSNCEMAHYINMSYALNVVISVISAISFLPTFFGVILKDNPTKILITDCVIFPILIVMELVCILLEPSTGHSFYPKSEKHDLKSFRACAITVVVLFSIFFIFFII